MPDSGRSASGSVSGAAPSGRGSEWPETDLVAARAASTPEREALVDAPTGRSWTYRELDAWVAALAAALDDRQETRSGASGETAFAGRIGVLSRPRPEVVALVHAAWRAGRELVPLNVGLAAGDLGTQLERAGVGTLLSDAAGRDLATAASEHAAAPADLAVADLATVADEGGDVTARSGGDDDVEYAVRATDVPVTLFTSGSTGEPKAVRLTVENLLSSATASAFRLGVARGDRWLSPLPTYHMGGLAPVVRCALYGSTVVLQREFDAARTADALDAHDATGVSLVPTALKRLLDADWTPPDALRFVLLGGAAADADLLARCDARDVPAYPTYGMTETASQIATATPEQAFADPDTVGQPLVNTTVHVVDATGDTVPPGDVGELVVSGPTVTPGYLDSDEAPEGGTADSGRGRFTARGFRTGDRGYRDDDGKVYVTGRVDDMIVTGGENVRPARVADALRGLDALADAAVVGLPDAEWGERVAALVVPRRANDGRLGTPEAVRDAVRDRLASHEVPKTVAFARSIPRTASGTVDRDALRTRLRED
jgi:O-succinylbenzoic acid--CoA ligase